MGYHVEEPANQIEYVPRICFNASGAEQWGGCHVFELTGMDVVSILKFCQSEGWRQGWNDANQNRIGMNAQGPFHEELLGGFPLQEWQRSYQCGVDGRVSQPVFGELAKNQG